MLDGAQTTCRASAAILPLPADVISQIQSSTTITSLTSVVLGLLENALDAQASKVNVTIDFRRGGCSIEDDGLGIAPSEFYENGGLGRMYYTSKHEDIATSEAHGGQGTFLASLAALSLLTITSRHCQHYSHNTLILHRSKAIARLTPAPPQQAIRSSTSHGTRVTVRDLFGNMPVRVKQRAMAVDESSESERMWQYLRKGITAVILAWKGPVNVRITDAESGTRGFSLGSTTSSSLSILTERNVNAVGQKVSSLNADRILNTLVKAGYTTFESKGSWISASASTLTVSLKGLISLKPAPNKTAQFISFGINPCSGESGHNELYDTVNRVFGQSSFGQIENESELDEAETERRKYDRRYKRDGVTNRNLNGAKKGVDRWPKFYLRFDLKHGSSRQALRKTDGTHSKSVIDVLEALVTQWLDANHFRPRKPRGKKNPTVDPSKNVPEPILRASSSMLSSKPIREGRCSGVDDFMLDSLPEDRTRTAREAALSIEVKKSRRRTVQTDGDLSKQFPAPQTTPFMEWSRIKSGRSSIYNNLWKGSNAFSTSATRKQDSVDHQRDKHQLGGLTIRIEPVCPAQATTDTATEAASLRDAGSFAKTSSLVQNNVDGIESDKVIEWIDPATKKQLRVNARTGVVLPDVMKRPVSDIWLSRQSAATNTSFSALGRPVNLERRRSTPVSRNTKSPTWLEEILKDWRNPVFANQQEQAIPVAAFDGPGFEVGEIEHRCKDREMQDTFLQAGRGSISRLSKAALSRAEVISQVDQKFILTKMPSASETNPEQLDLGRPILVLMDQHAASERCILERLLKELCTASIERNVTPKSNLGHSSRIQTSKLDKPMHFQVSSNEGMMFKAHATHFARWGVLYDIGDVDSTSYSPRSHDIQLKVLTLPPGIAERCKVEPKLLIETLRAEIFAMAELPYSTARYNDNPIDETDQHPWLRQLGSCPKGIIDLLNSRACRSAIMFNDKLSLQECEQLVEQLANCAFPFMCAHGRVSMVPLVYLDDNQGGGQTGGHEFSIGSAVFNTRQSSNPQEGFASAYKRWRVRRKA